MGTTAGLRGADLIGQLLREPQQFDFVQAMELLEASDVDDLAFGQGLDQRVRLQPSEDLVFPAADIRDCRRSTTGLTLLLNFMGLYGVDAPVPHYLLDRTTAEDDDAARMRDFLDVFNQRFYVLLYRALQISRPAAGRLPAAFSGTASALSGQILLTQERRRFPAGRVRTAAGLRALLQDYMNDAVNDAVHDPMISDTTHDRTGGTPVEVEDGRPTWAQLGEGCTLGGQTTRLGDNTVLGGRAWMASGAVAIRLGPVDAEQARNLLPGHRQHARLQALVGEYLPAQVESELHIRVRPSCQRNAAAGLGKGELHLGWSVWLGERLDDEYLVRVALNAPCTDTVPTP
ncbi:MAG: type VI secretion system baseplate subunit TssG [Alcanivorax sp.]|nr:type VI secretion system baseplate subunit TssG [Alcanivorax sp.]